MSDPIVRHEVLVVYCLNHHCADCPMNDPHLGCLDDEDDCVVGMAIDVLEPDLGVAP